MGARKELILIEQIISYIFPNVCGICGKICENSLCPSCSVKLKKIAKYEIESISNKNFSYLAYLFKYSGIIREKLIVYKFKDHSYLYKTFSKIIIKNKKICRFIKSYDIIISVPIHKKRFRQRGYNQSELLAREISRNLEVPIEKEVLIKTKNNNAQSTLNKSERIKNTIDVYAIINSEKVKNKKVLLVDDIYTTGSTANECSRMLKQAGASEIAVLTIAKD